MFPLTQHSDDMAVWKVVIPPERERRLRTHAGYEWLYVLSGEMKLILGEHDVTMRPGEVAEFDTQLPHWFGPAGDEPVEILSVHGKPGATMHVRAAPRTRPLKLHERSVDPDGPPLRLVDSAIRCRAVVLAEGV